MLASLRDESRNELHRVALVFENENKKKHKAKESERTRERETIEKKKEKVTEGEKNGRIEENIS